MATAATTTAAALSHARALLAGRTSILAITGAGISTDSGIPDYRSPGRPPHRPTSHQQFMASQATRQRYWARSMQGYDTLASSQPNSGHFALAYAERAGRVKHIITQNVDLLHCKAGSSSVLHLHGTVRDVRCMSCEALADRAEFQRKLHLLNPSFSTLAPRPDPLARELDHRVISPSSGVTAVSLPRAIPTAQRPDGDSDLVRDDYSEFIIPSCAKCTDGFGRPLDGVAAQHLPGQPAGVLKPDLVFFGANVPKGVHERADGMLASSDALLIAGTSLTVWSAFRLVRAALDRAAPGQVSVVEVASQMAKWKQLAGTGAHSIASGNSIADGSAILAPVTPFAVQLETDASFPRRAPATLPVIILNQGPTRADQFLEAASSGVHKVEARTSDALHHLFDVPREATHAMEQELQMTRRTPIPRTSNARQQSLQARLLQHENIE